MALLDRPREWARGIKRDVVAVYFAARDPRTPLVPKLLAIVVAAYDAFFYSCASTVGT